MRGEAEMQQSLLPPRKPSSSSNNNNNNNNYWRAECNKLWGQLPFDLLPHRYVLSLTLITQSQLAAISIATTFIISITFGFLLASALETLCGQAYGGKQYHLFDATFLGGVVSSASFYLTGGVGLVSPLILMFLPHVNSISFYGWESMIPLGLLAATGIRVANEIGSGNGNSARFAAKVAVFNSLIIALVVFSIIIAFPDKIAMFFTSSAPVITMVEELAKLLAVTVLFNCIQPILSGVAVGSGWQALVAYINIGSYYLFGLPLGIILGWWFHFGFQGIWAGMLCGSLIQTLILTGIAIRRPWAYEVKVHRTIIHDQAIDEENYHTH